MRQANPYPPPEILLNYYLIEAPMPKILADITRKLKHFMSYQLSLARQSRKRGEKLNKKQLKNIIIDSTILNSGLQYGHCFK